MRELISQLLNHQLSRRNFVNSLTGLGVSLASAEALLTGIAGAAPDANTLQAAGREVSGNGSDLLFETLLEADVRYIFHGCGGGINRFFDSIVTRPQFRNFLWVLMKARQSPWPRGTTLLRAVKSASRSFQSPVCQTPQETFTTPW